jgi:hypothetical protein
MIRFWNNFHQVPHINTNVDIELSVHDTNTNVDIE